MCAGAEWLSSSVSQMVATGQLSFSAKRTLIFASTAPLYEEERERERGRERVRERESKRGRERGGRERARKRERESERET